MTKRIVFVVSIALGFGFYAGQSLAESGDDLYAVAAGHYSQARWQLAAEAFDEFLTNQSDHPKFRDAQFYFAESMVQLRDYNSAFAAYSKLLESSPDYRHSARASFRRGEAALLSNRREIAAEILTQFSAKHPGHELNAYALPYLGEYAFRKQNHIEAQQFYERALRLFPTGPLADESHLHLGVIHYGAENWASALSHLKNFGSRFPNSSLKVEAIHWRGLALLKSGEVAEAALTLAELGRNHTDHPLGPASTYFAGNAYRLLEEHDNAAEAFQLLVNTWPKSRFADDAIIGLIHLAENDYEAIRPLVTQLEEMKPASKKIMEGKRQFAKALLRNHRFVEAVDVLRPLSEQPSLIRNDEDETLRQTHRYLLAAGLLGQQQFRETLNVIDEIDVEKLDASLLQSTLVARTDALIGLEDYDAALRSLDDYLTAHPRGTGAEHCLANRVLVLIRLNRIEDASAAYDRLATEFPVHQSRWSIARELADAAYEAGNRDIASRLFASLTENGQIAIDTQNGLSGLAWCYFEEGKYKKAVDAFRRLRTEFPDNVERLDATLAQAKAHEHLGELDEAISLYELVTTDQPASEHAAKALLAAAGIEQDRGRHAAALEILDTFTNQFSEHDQFDAGLYLKAWALHDSGMPEEAAKEFERLHDDYRDSRFWSDATYRLADSAYKQGDVDRAQQLLEALETNGRTMVTPYALYLKARLAIAKQDWNAADEPLKRLLKEHPTSDVVIPASYWHAETAYRLGENETAYSGFRILSTKVAGRTDQWLAMIPLRRAQILAKRKDWFEAAKFADQVRNEFPDFPHRYEADYIRGRCFAADGEFTKARSCYKEVISSPTGGKTETAAMAQWMTGESHFHQRNYGQALRDYLQVEILYPYPRWQAAGLLQAGQCYEHLGKIDEAAKLYRTIQRNYSTTEFHDDAVARLEAVVNSPAKTALTPSR